MKRVLFFLLLLLILISTIYILAQIFVWEKLYCTYYDIDINSGDIRTQNFVAFVLVDEKITRTSFSKLVRKYNFQKKIAIWKRSGKSSVVKNLSSGVGGYSGAISYCDTFVLMTKTVNVPEEKLKSLLRQCLRYLKAGELRKFRDEMYEVAEKYD